MASIVHESRENLVEFRLSRGCEDIVDFDQSNEDFIVLHFKLGLSEIYNKQPIGIAIF